MIKTHAEHAAELSAYRRKEIDEERPMECAESDMWAMTLEEMDCALRRSMRGRISKHHRAIIQGMIDDIDDIASKAPGYILD